MAPHNCAFILARSGPRPWIVRLESTLIRAVRPPDNATPMKQHRSPFVTARGRPPLGSPGRRCLPLAKRP
eukprot:15113671-Alexandrium_andersonii.AAC.1